MNYTWPTVTTEVTAPSGLPVPGAPVTFTISNPSSGYFQLAGGPGSSATVTTDNSGTATAPPILAGEAGTFTLTASSVGMNGPLSTSGRFTSAGIA